MTWFWLAILSAFLSASAAIIQKRILFDVRPLDFSLIVSGLIAVLSTPLLALTDFGYFDMSSLMYLFLKSVLNAFAFLCIMTALKNLQLSRALPVLAATPMFIALLAFIFLGESLSAYEVTGMFLIVTGTYILELKKEEGFLHPLTVFKNSGYHRIILLALLLMSVSSVMDKFILVKFKLPPVLFVVVQNYFFLLIFLITYLLTGKNSFGSVFKSVKSRQLFFLILITALLTIGYRLAQIGSVKLAPVGVVISLKRLSVLFAVLIGTKIFREESYFKKIAATFLIVAGAMMIYED
ncbi:MAG: EamA family transporter [Bacteroidetes bacterium]|nr:EamA family transporter [Bacteroidota bacterium]